MKPLLWQARRNFLNMHWGGLSTNYKRVFQWNRRTTVTRSWTRVRTTAPASRATTTRRICPSRASVHSTTPATSVKVFFLPQIHQFDHAHKSELQSGEVHDHNSDKAQTCPWESKTLWFVRYSFTVQTFTQIDCQRRTPKSASLGSRDPRFSLQMRARRRSRCATTARRSGRCASPTASASTSPTEPCTATAPAPTHSPRPPASAAVSRSSASRIFTCE